MIYGPRILYKTELKEDLRFLIEQRGLKQSDLSDIAPQGLISNILAGQRFISKGLANKLAQRVFR